jgi:hypothetical protein
VAGVAPYAERSRNEDASGSAGARLGLSARLVFACALYGGYEQVGLAMIGPANVPKK